ncbi:putative ABC transporter ATP-binding protein [Selenomonas ruminantium subsp. lactilytica TAM6421]|uniref:Putative ABC transporter ATP-binding protein n=1 Tax=Selenomonas ruminantium subsp. lactilytica (strain NBRC 103574 / TAM6421) TaxID=927704 RepID=I0GUP3_SELRL|nr:ABC transporter ATP-binding protein [Selenomonas ruminantium]BAL84480.1 putative ABC transporter ATP-binding protein [Selenomonas ruminantium subsp. lactilytica TAM6421]
MQEKKWKLVLSKVSRDYTGNGNEEPVNVLNNLNLKVEEGEFISIVGPSGCGKSTLLDLLAGLSQPSSGEILVDGQPTSETAVRCGMVQQGYALFPWLTVRENVEFPLSLRNVPKEERRQISQRELRKVFMEGYEDRYPDELSGGMRQRVAIARALASDPPFLLMDEPFAALDPETRATLQDELLHITSTTNKTIIFVTHDVFEAAALADRVVVMKANPGTFREVVDVTVPWPRSIATLRDLPELREITNYIGKLIHREQPAAYEEEISDLAVI